MGGRKLIASFSHALAGIVYAFISERNMRVHGAATIIIVALGCILHLERLEWGLLFLTIFMVLVAETINTAVEISVDLITNDYHPLAKLAKNVAAGAVLLAAINALIMAVVIFGPYLSNFNF
ncbi:MAG: diacylglycerol kinase family protein [Syntrophomonadaceae bacterium]|nr:diacylglycerol kinase family protein [Syntrophomonadaceae bacterium]MDD3023181.1 diacylglycerol kinase family protein [Syntrophomonadaceae bacterium]